MNDAWISVWKQPVASSLTVLSRVSPGRTEEKREDIRKAGRPGDASWRGYELD
jgi:hypothetical protein